MHSLILRHYMAWVGRKGKIQSVKGGVGLGKRGRLGRHGKSRGNAWEVWEIMGTPCAIGGFCRFAGRGVDLHSEASIQFPQNRQRTRPVDNYVRKF